MVEEGEDTGARQEEDYYYRKCILLFRSFTSYVDSISEEVAGFSPFMVSPMKKTVFIVSCVVLMFYCCACYSFSKDPNIMLA